MSVKLLNKVARTLLADLLNVGSFELFIYVVGAPEMTRLNEVYLRHAGSTDVLAFDYADGRREGTLFGEIFVCTDEALIQAKRFHTTWQEELVRYVVHGTLHLLGHDDHSAAKRRTMKREENRLLRELAGGVDLQQLGRGRRNNSKHKTSPNAQRNGKTRRKLTT